MRLLLALDFYNDDHLLRESARCAVFSKKIDDVVKNFYSNVATSKSFKHLSTNDFRDFFNKKA